MLACRMGTFDTLYRMIAGAVIPGGRTRMTDCDIAEICATAASIFAPGWKKTLITLTPFNDCDSICSMSLTVVVIPRSLGVTIRFSISSAATPLYDQMTETTGISISGKMSVDIR